MEVGSVDILQTKTLILVMIKDDHNASLLKIRFFKKKDFTCYFFFFFLSFLINGSIYAVDETALQRSFGNEHPSLFRNKPSNNFMLLSYLKLAILC